MTEASTEKLKSEDLHPAVGVIVPVYNAEKVIERCALSILSQTYGNVSLYLINDGSKDGSRKVLDDLKEKYPNVTVVHKENEGPMATALRGVRESREPFLMFVDGDDYLELTCLETMMAALLPDPSLKQVVCGGYVVDREWNDTHQKLGNGAAPGVYEGEKLEKEIREKILGNEQRTITMSRCMKVFTRELIEDNAHYCDSSIRMGDDLNVILPALLDADRIVVLPDNYDYHYIFYRTSLVHHYDAGMADNLRRLKPIIREILKDKNIPDYESMTEREYLFLFFILMKNEIRNKDRDAAAKTAAICREEDTPKLIEKYGFPTTESANRLLLFFMKKPTVLRVKTVQAVFRLRDRMNGDR